MYVKELFADPDTRMITGTLVDPLRIADPNEDPQPDGSGSSLCTCVVAPKGYGISAYVRESVFKAVLQGKQFVES